MKVLRAIAAALLAGGLTWASLAIADDAERKAQSAYRSSDFAEALRQYRPLAEKGHAVAQFMLGVMYSEGQGVPQDHAAALKWYRLAAERGHVWSQYTVGRAYDNGIGVPQDYAAAVKWYRLAAEQGNVDAQNNLGIMYYSGKGVPQDYAAAYMWLNLAAASGLENPVKNRDLAAKQLTAAELEAAQRLSRECLARNYKNC